MLSSPVIAETSPPPGMPDGGCWRTMTDIPLTVPASIGVKKGNKEGVTNSRVGAWDRVLCYVNSNTYLINSSAYISADIVPTLIPSDINPGHYKFTDNLDANIELAVGGFSGGYPTAYDVIPPVTGHPSYLISGAAISKCD